MEPLFFLQNTWYVLLGVLLIGYSILDGFDLGVGCLVPFLANNDAEKRMLFNAIGPFWDGNEVWLLTGGGALFAAFPHVYATVFSGFYLALMLVLFSLIFRAVALEFWSYDEKRKKLWEWAFVVGSFLPSLLYGVALGNVVVGIPLNEQMEFTGNFFTLLRPFPLAVGLLGFAAILLQGCTYTVLKTSGLLKEQARKTARIIWSIFMVLLFVTFILAFIFMSGIAGNKLAYVTGLIVLAAWFLTRQSLNNGNDGQAFFMSSVAFAGLWGVVGAIHYPNLVLASNDPALSLTLSNSSSTQLTLTVMLIIALVGMPFVIGYTIYAYTLFKGKVILYSTGHPGK